MFCFIILLHLHTEPLLESIESNTSIESIIQVFFIIKE